MTRWPGRGKQDTTHSEEEGMLRARSALPLLGYGVGLAQLQRNEMTWNRALQTVSRVTCCTLLYSLSACVDGSTKTSVTLPIHLPLDKMHVHPPILREYSQRENGRRRNEGAKRERKVAVAG